MAHSFAVCNIHYVFSTKDRANLIYADIQDRLWAFMGGIARQNNISPLAIGGTDNHAHALLGIPAAMPLAKAVQLVKGGSSKWLGETFSQCADFAWQEGYGAFSVSASVLPEVRRYITSQLDHHGHRTFEQEYVMMLERHGIEFDVDDVFG